MRARALVHRLRLLRLGRRTRLQRRSTAVAPPEAGQSRAGVCDGVEVKTAPILCAVAVLGIGACGGSSGDSCVTVPEPISSASLITNGTKLTVRVGAIVYVVLVQSASYTAGPGFPWLTPRSSDLTVFAPLHLCKRTGASSLPLSVTGFRAVHPGTATLTAPLAPPWRSLKTRPSSSRSSVTVLP